MNGSLKFTIDLILLTLGVFGSLVFAYVGLKIVRAISEGRLRPEHLVSDKGSNIFSLSKVGQSIGMIALTVAFIFVVTQVNLSDDSIGSWIYWLFAAYGTIMILPQAWTNFLNSNKPPALPGSVSIQTDTVKRTQTQEQIPQQLGEGR